MQMPNRTKSSGYTRCAAGARPPSMSRKAKTTAMARSLCGHSGSAVSLPPEKTRCAISERRRRTHQPTRRPCAWGNALRHGCRGFSAVCCRASERQAAFPLPASGRHLSRSLATMAGTRQEVATCACGRGTSQPAVQLSSEMGHTSNPSSRLLRGWQEAWLRTFQSARCRCLTPNRLPRCAGSCMD